MFVNEIEIVISARLFKFMNQKMFIKIQSTLSSFSKFSLSEFSNCNNVAYVLKISRSTNVSAVLEE